MCDRVILLKLLLTSQQWCGGRTEEVDRPACMFSRGTMDGGHGSMQYSATEQTAQTAAATHQWWMPCRVLLQLTAHCSLLREVVVVVPILLFFFLLFLLHLLPSFSVRFFFLWRVLHLYQRRHFWDLDLSIVIALR